MAIAKKKKPRLYDLTFKTVTTSRLRSSLICLGSSVLYGESTLSGSSPCPCAWMEHDVRADKISRIVRFARV